MGTALDVPDGLSHALARVIRAREALTLSEGLYRSKVSRTPICGYGRDEGPTVDIDGIMFCICLDCVGYRIEDSWTREPMLDVLDPRDAEDDDA